MDLPSPGGSRGDFPDPSGKNAACQWIGSICLPCLSTATGLPEQKSSRPWWPGLYSAGAADGVLDQALLEAELAATVPLSVTMAESLARLRQWCQGRAVHAGA
ncbi:hypothetical protein [Alcanivorax sp.]|uniref:hypothetical protein n=1 Tax=Alcanivorax sp. TaxID=1872427 RepID=UPI003BAA0200